MKLNPVKSAAFVLLSLGGATFAEISCTIPDFRRYLDDTVIVVDRGDYVVDTYYDDGWYYDCCW